MTATTSEMDPHQGKRIYHSLDALRGVAAISVVLLHYHEYIAPINVGSAYLAVDLFFLMSGFVIAKAYHDRLDRSLGGGQFMLARFIRLYPLYLIGTLITLIPTLLSMLVFKTHHWSSWRLLAGVALPALIMLPGVTTNPERQLYPLNMPSWSLLSEMIVNALYGCVPQVRRGWAMPVAITTISALGLIVATTSLHGLADVGWRWPTWWFGPLRACFSFFLGVIFFKLEEARRLPLVKVWLVPVFTIVLAVLYATPPAQWRVLYDLFAIMVLFPLFLWLCVVNQPRVGLPVYTFLGTASYPLYTVHMPILIVASGAIQRLLGGRAQAWAPWFGFGIIALVFAFSWVLARTYDGWARRALTRFAGYIGAKPGHPRFAGR